MGEISTSAGRIGIEFAGSGDLTPILFLHGVGSDKSVWRSQLDYFSQARRAVAIDYPGYGDSASCDGATLDDFARAAFATLDALDIKSAHICGLSLGGVVALAMSALASARCASLILADSFALHPDGAAIHQRAVDASWAGPMRALAEARAPSLLGDAARSNPILIAEIVDTMGRIDSAAYRQGAAAVWLADQRTRAAAVALPTLVIVGSEDTITPPALSQALAALIDNARLVEITGAGHLTNIESPAEFNRVVDAFLTEIDT